jgi:tetratricopeptide (TPR) repeat protein
MPNPVAGAETEDALARAAAFALRRHPDRPVWVVASSGYFTDAQSETLKTGMEGYGLALSGKMLPSIETLWVYRVTGSPAGDPLAGAGGGAPELDHFVAQAFGNLGAAYAAAGDKDGALAALDALMQKSGFAAKIYGSLAASVRADAPTDAKLAAVRALWDGYGYRDNGFPRLALAAFRDATRADDQLAIAWAELGISGMECFGSAPWDQYENPATALARAAALDPEYAKPFARLIDVLNDPSKGNLAQSLAAYQAYQEGQVALGRGENEQARDLLRRAVAADPLMLAAYPPLAYAMTLLGDLDGALQSVADYRKQGGAPDAGVWGNVAMVRLIKGDRAGAEEAMREAFRMDAGLEKLYGGIFSRFFGGDKAGALAEAERLTAAGVPVPAPLLEYLRSPAAP